MPNNSFCTVGVAYGSRIAGTHARHGTPMGHAGAQLVSSPILWGLGTAPWEGWLGRSSSESAGALLRLVALSEGGTSVCLSSSPGKPVPGRAGWVCARAAFPEYSQHATCPATELLADAHPYRVAKARQTCNDMQRIGRPWGSKCLPIPCAPPALGLGSALCGQTGGKGLAAHLSSSKPGSVPLWPQLSPELSRSFTGWGGRRGLCAGRDASLAEQRMMLLCCSLGRDSLRTRQMVPRFLAETAGWAVGGPCGARRVLGGRELAQGHCRWLCTPALRSAPSLPYPDGALPEQPP